MEIAEICKMFLIDGKFLNFKEINSGNINNTYLIKFLKNDIIHLFILQRINRYVFKEPDKVMKNVINITNHILLKNKNYSANCDTLRFISTKMGLPYFIDKMGDYWRMYIYIENSVSYNNPDDLYIIEQAGSAFGKFQCELNDFDTNSLYKTIENFHNTELWFDNLFKSASIDSVNRVNYVENELKYLQSEYETACYFCNYIKNGKLHEHVTHNDTKCNNVLFDIQTKKALAVIDLDTVMPGLIAYDFGDGVRSISATTNEDEEDILKIDFNLEKFEAFTKGFLRKTAGVLTECEAKTLYMAPLVITLELSARFLKDYIDGDLYFKTKYNTHNLIRARNQIELSKKIKIKSPEIKKIIQKYV